jgi:hypothetical protein
MTTSLSRDNLKAKIVRSFKNQMKKMIKSKIIMTELLLKIVYFEFTTNRHLITFWLNFIDFKASGFWGFGVLGFRV